MTAKIKDSEKAHKTESKHTAHAAPVPSPKTEATPERQGSKAAPSSQIVDTKGITVKKAEDMPEWYSQVCIKAQLADFRERRPGSRAASSLRSCRPAAPPVADRAPPCFPLTEAPGGLPPDVARGIAHYC